MADLYRTRDDILAEMLSEIQGAIPDVYVGDDGVIYILFSVESGQFENAFLANQLLLNDQFVQTASLQALVQHGAQYGLQLQEGIRAQGALQFSGGGGTYIPLFAEASYDPGNGLDLVFFRTTIDGTVPNPGAPTPPNVAVGANVGQTGSYEYVVTFVTAEGETTPSDMSQAISAANQKIDLSAIPAGGTGTIKRRIYRDKNGEGVFRLVTEIGDNTTTTFTDAVADATVATGATPPIDDTAMRITLTAEATDPGVEGNAQAGTVQELTDAPSGLTEVTNPVAFTGGTDDEETEHFRNRLLAYLQNAQTGSPADLKAWSEAVPGVDSATVFVNDNLGVATPGHTTVRITAAGGGVPSQSLLDAVYATLMEKNVANVTLHVTGFTALATDVTADVTLDPQYVIGDITPSVQEAVINYIAGLPVGGTLYISGLIAAIEPLPGVIDVVITTPASNQTTPASTKRTPGAISVV